MFNTIEVKQILLSLDDEYFYESISELEPLISDGWVASTVEPDYMTNSSLVTLTKNMSKHSLSWLISNFSKP